MKSIRWKMIAATAGGVLFTILVAILLSQLMLNKTTNHTQQLLAQQLEQKEAVVQQAVQTKVDDTVSVAVLLAEQLALQPELVEAINTNDAALIHEALKESTEIAKEKANIDLIWVTRLEDRTSDGRTPILACPTNPSFDGFDGLNYVSTNQALDTGETVASWEVNEEDGKLQVTAPIKDQGRVIGAIVVGQQTYQAFLKNIAEASNTGSTLFLAAGDSDFYVMTDSQTDAVGDQFFNDSRENQGMEAPNVSELAKANSMYEKLLPHLNETRKTKAAFSETIELSGQSYALNFKPLLSHNEQVVGVLVSRFPGVIASQQEILDQTRSLQIISYAACLVMIVASVVITYFASRSIINPILSMKRVMEGIANGDFSGRVKYKGKDELSGLTEGINHAAEQLSKLTEQTSLSASQVASASDQLLASTEQNTQASQSIAESLDSVTSVSENLNESSAQAAQIMQEIRSELKNIGIEGKEMKQFAESTDKIVSTGSRQIQKVRQQMNVVREDIQQTSKSLMNLNQASEKIGEITTLITSLSEQTNLLALNAAIEAARAGGTRKRIRRRGR